jgi:predicted O-methyltransferase YrrM
MDPHVSRVIEQVCAEAQLHDAGEPRRLRRWRVLEPPAGELLWFLVQLVQARQVIEIGTSRGVSTLWLAAATRATSGHVTSIDNDADAQRVAAQHLDRAGLIDQVIFRVGDGGRVLAEMADGSVDLLFLDAERSEYAGWWPHPRRVLRPGGLLVVDNANSHPEQIAPLREQLASDAELVITTLGVGKGELMAFRSH